MLFKVLERSVKRGNMDIEKKIDVFYADGKLTEKEYKKLKSMVGGA